MFEKETIRRPRVLVIDDDPLFRSLIVSFLRKDYFVQEASDGEEGFRKAVAHPPDIAIVDVQMPCWDGLKTLRAFRNNETLSNLPIMMLTSDASRETVLTAINAGATDYLIKSSFSKSEFLTKLSRLLEFTENNQCVDWQGRQISDMLSSGSPQGFGLAVETAADDNEIQEILDAWE